MKCHIIAFIAGFVLDRIIGDPMNMPHPIRLIGNLISFLDKLFLGKKGCEYKRNSGREVAFGILLCLIVVCLSALVPGAILYGAYRIHVLLGIAVEAVLTCYIFAAKSLKDESMKVYHALKTGTIEDARYAVSMIVGRDTENLTAEGVTKAAVETVAENTSDGVIAPLIYTFLGGPVLGFAYKGINTMDSMVGYHNDRYEYFGKAAAKLDDIVNFLPARISAVVMIVAAAFLGKDYSAGNAFRIFKRDRYNHKSPNSAQTESACAGALSIRLAGDASYFGKILKKPFIGDDIRPIEVEDIKRANKLMYMTEDLSLVILLIIYAAIAFI